MRIVRLLSGVVVAAVVATGAIAGAPAWADEYTPPPDDPGHTSDGSGAPTPGGGGSTGDGYVVDPPDNDERFDVSIEAVPATASIADLVVVTITVENWGVTPATDDLDQLGVQLDWNPEVLRPVSVDGPNQWWHEWNGRFDQTWPDDPGDVCFIAGMDAPDPVATGTCTATFQQRRLGPGQSTQLEASIDSWAALNEEEEEETWVDWEPVSLSDETSSTTTVTGGPADPPADGAGFDVAIAHTPEVLRWGHAFELAVTVTNVDVVPPDVDPYAGLPLMVVVRLDWEFDAQRLPADPDTEDGCGFWTDAYLAEDPVDGMDFDFCYLEGLTEPGSTVTFTVPFRVGGPQPATSGLAFAATVDQWSYYAGERYVSLPINPATAVESIPVAPLYELTVENFDFLGIGAVGSPDPVLGRYTVYSSEAQLRGFDDAELVVRLAWPAGLALSGAPPGGCVSSGEQSLDCTIDDANVLPGETESPADDEVQRYLATWDLLFDLPATQAERELLDAFTIGFVSGWAQTLPIISLAAAASDPPEYSVEMDSTWTDSDSVPFATLDRVFPTETTTSTQFPVPGGDAVEVVFRVTHSPEVTTVLPGVEVSVRLDWPSFLEPAGDPAGCADYTAGVCLITGLDAPGAFVDLTMSFEVPADAVGSGSFSISGESVVIREENSDGEIVHAYPADWVVPSSARVVVFSDVFVTQVTIDRDPTWVGGDDLVATVRVQWKKELAFLERRGVVVGIALDWGAGAGGRVALVGPPGVEGCDEYADGVCTLEDWQGVGDVHEVTIRLRPIEVGNVQVSAEGAFLVVPTVSPSLSAAAVPSGIELPPTWITGDADQSRVVDARFDVDLALDHDPGYRGGHPLNTTTTLTRSPATDGGEGYDPTLGDTTVRLAWTWPGFLSSGTVVGCPGFAVQSCTLPGFDAVGATAQVGIQFPMPAPDAAQTAPISGPLTVDVASVSFDVVTRVLPPVPVLPEPEPTDSAEPSAVVGDPVACDPDVYDLCCTPPYDTDCVADPLPEPVEETERTEAPAAWLGGDEASFTLLQPMAWFVPAVANPGDVVTLFTRYFPPGEAPGADWRLDHAQATPTTLPTSFVGGAIGSTDRREIVVLRRALPGTRFVEFSSPVGTFGTFPSRGILIAPRSSVAPNLVGRGG